MEFHEFHCFNLGKIWSEPNKGFLVKMKMSFYGPTGNTSDKFYVLENSTFGHNLCHTDFRHFYVATKGNFTFVANWFSSFSSWFVTLIIFLLTINFQANSCCVLRPVVSNKISIQREKA